MAIAIITVSVSPELNIDALGLDRNSERSSRQHRYGCRRDESRLHHWGILLLNLMHRYNEDERGKFHFPSDVSWEHCAYIVHMMRRRTIKAKGHSGRSVCRRLLDRQFTGRCAMGLSDVSCQLTICRVDIRLSLLKIQFGAIEGRTSSP